MKRKIFCLLAILLFTTNTFTQTKEKLEAAVLNNNVAFLVATDGNSKFSEAKEIASQAQKKYPKSEVIALDRLDQTNAALISKYGLSGAPTPIILVLASNGVVTGGYVLDQASPDILVDAIPTKNQAEALLAFSEGKAAFIVLYKKSMIDKTTALEACKNAEAGLNAKAKVVEIDLEDKSEAKFLNLLKPEMEATITHVLVFNAKGQFTGEFQSPVASDDLIASSLKVLSSGCAPGAGSGCCPK
jgi:hypothetical protein